MNENQVKLIDLNNLKDILLIDYIVNMANENKRLADKVKELEKQVNSDKESF